MSRWRRHRHGPSIRTRSIQARIQSQQHRAETERSTTDESFHRSRGETLRKDVWHQECDGQIQGLRLKCQGGEQESSSFVFVHVDLIWQCRLNSKASPQQERRDSMLCAHSCVSVLISFPFRASSGRYARHHHKFRRRQGLLGHPCAAIFRFINV